MNTALKIKMNPRFPQAGKPPLNLNACLLWGNVNRVRSASLALLFRSPAEREIDTDQRDVEGDAQRADESAARAKQR